MFRIFDEIGDIIFTDVHCSFSYKNKNYAIMTDYYTLDDSLVCMEIAWNPWRGTYIKGECAFKKVSDLADDLLQKNEADPQKYPMRGEHYVIKESGSEQKIRRIIKQKRHFMFSNKASYINGFCKWLASCLMAFLYAYLYVNTVGVMWAYTIFPDWQKRTLVLLMYVFQFLSTTALFLIRKNKRTFLDLFYNVLFPLNIITLFGAVKSSIVLKWIVIAVFSIGILFCVVPKLINVIRAKKRKVKFGEIKKAIRRISITVAICIVICAIGAKFFGVSGSSFISSYKGSYAQSDAVQENFHKAIEKINENVWPTLSLQERVDVLQNICDYECIFTLGCDTAIVQTGYPEDEECLGEYNNISGVITINLEHLKQSHIIDVLNTLLHETRHVWQHTIAEMYEQADGKIDEKYFNLPIFRQAMKFSYNFDTYCSGSDEDDFGDYYDQDVERDSRYWAEYTVEKYYDYCVYIDKYLAEEQEQQAAEK